MNNRVTSDSANSVSLFPFLAVLLCTMGALLVLLVVLAQRAGERVVAEPQPVRQAAFEDLLAVESEDAAEVAKLTSQLTEVLTYQQRLAELRKQADQRLLEEQQRLTHFEAHARRLEHELARLSIAAEQLKATEQNQSIDQEQAERELVRLQQLIENAEAQIEKLHEQAKGKQSYAILPFQGKDGSIAPRIYIECCQAGVIIRPEGIRFEERDFFDTDWAGNPLVQVIRATQQRLRENAIAAGESDPPLALPLFLVRPDGSEQFYAAQDAVHAWGGEYGYDFVGGEGELNFPVAADPLLAQEQQQARMNAREQLVRRIRSAPRRFQAKLAAAGIVDGSSISFERRSNSSGSFGGFAQTSSSGQGKGRSKSASGEPQAEGSGQPTDGEQQDPQYGALDGNGNSDDAVGDFAVDGTTTEAQAGFGEGRRGGTDAAQSQDQAGMAQSQAGMLGAPSTASAGGMQGDFGSNGALAAGDDSAGPTESSYGISGEFREAENETAPTSEDWAVLQKRRRNAVPIQRPIQVIVRKGQFTLMPSRHMSDTSAAAGKDILMDRPPKQIAKEFSAVLREHMDEWGIAGQGLYWKPVLNFKIGPDGADTAIRLAKLLAAGSGVEVRLPEDVRLSQGGRSHAPR